MEHKWSSISTNILKRILLHHFLGPELIYYIFFKEITKMCFFCSLSKHWKCQEVHFCKCALFLVSEVSILLHSTCTLLGQLITLIASTPSNLRHIPWLSSPFLLMHPIALRNVNGISCGMGVSRKWSTSLSGLAFALWFFKWFGG